MSTNTKKNGLNLLLSFILTIMLVVFTYLAFQQYIGLLSNKEQTGQKQQAVSNKMTKLFNSGATLKKM